jgi:hypothetical protein
LNQAKQDARSLYLWSFTLRFAIGLAAWLMIELAAFNFLQDALFYEEVGAGVADDWLAGRQSLWLQSAMADGMQGWLLVALIAAFYYVLGGIRALPLLLALYSAITALTPVITYKIGLSLGVERKYAIFAARLVVFSPAFAFWAGALYKEGLIFLALNLIVYSTLQLQQVMRARSLIVLAGSLAALAGLRLYLAVIAGAAIAVSLIFGHRADARIGSRAVTLTRQVATIMLLVIATWALGFSDTVLRVMPRSQAEFVQKVEISRKDLATASSGYMRELNLSSPAKMVAYLPLGVGYFLTVPLPWHIGQLRQNLTIPETIFWIALYPLMIMGILRGMKQNMQGTVLILILTVAAVLFYGAFIGNIGTAYRMRAQIWLLWAVFAGWGLQSLRERRTRP